LINLNYSSFIQLIRDHYAYDIEQEALAGGLLQSITNPSIHYKFSPSYLSYIWNGERNVTKEVIEESEKPSNMKKCIDHFNATIIPDLSKHLLDDFYDKLGKLILSDSSIQESKKNSLERLFVSKDYGKYLAYVFLYAIRRDNKGVVTKIEPNDIELLQEANQECVLCRTPLVETKAKQGFFRYSVTKIFPESLNPKEILDFNTVHRKPLDLEDKNNLVCLCDKCGSDYLYSPDLPTYDKLYRFKWRSIKHDGLKKSTSAYHIEEEITMILENIKDADYDDDSFKVLRMKPIKITNKILPDNRTLVKAIKDDVDVYYYFIKDQLATLDDYKQSFKQIALEVKTCFLSLSKITDDQDEIYNALVQWIIDSQRLPDSYRIAAHTVISFFVQNCEVFDEIS